MEKTVVFALAALAALMPAAGAAAYADIHQDPARAQITAAIEMYEESGLGAITVHSDREHYPFVLDRDGRVLAHGANPSLVGTHALDSIRPDKTLEQINAELDADGESRIYYIFLNPATGRDEVKHTLLILHDGYVFGSGTYAARHDPPAMQYRDGVFPSAIQCNAPMEPFLRDSAAPTCLKPSTHERLSELGHDLAAYGTIRDWGMHTVTVGLLAPVSGGAAGYGQDITEAARMAAGDLNTELEAGGHPWRLDVIAYDTGTDGSREMEGVAELREQGVRLVVGPSIDIFERDVIDYADDSGMLLFSCCSVVTDYATAGDSLMRMISDHRGHGKELAWLMASEGIKVVVPAGRDGIWVTDLIYNTHSVFIEITGTEPESGEDYGATGWSVAPQPEPMLYDASGRFEPRHLEMLSETVSGQVGIHGADKVAVLFIGFEETYDFLEEASKHDALAGVRWFGADANTVPAGSAEALRFAEAVQFTSVQPTVPYGDVTEDVGARLAEVLGRQPSVYAFFAYDAMRLIGEAVLDGQTGFAPDVADGIVSAALEYEGASGSNIEFSEAGDRLRTDYAVWQIMDGAWTQASLLEHFQVLPRDINP